MRADHSIVPVVMFHSVGLDESDWVFSHISEPLTLFEEKLARLSGIGYHFLFWNELYEHMAGRRRAPPHSIMLTFDDGYLDNWVYVYPLLKKYGAKATIFVNPDFVDPESAPRPNLDNVWAGSIQTAGLQAAGFLSWSEMRAMEAAGVVDIQSHGLTHTWYFSGPGLIDFHRPGKYQYPWLAWNHCPEKKPFYMIEDQTAFVPWGYPVYEHEKALICRRYFPPGEVLDVVTDFVAEHGGPDFFTTESWRPRLEDQHARLMEKYGINGRWETEEDYRNRVYYELKESKEQIETHLNKRVDFICWPGGGYNITVLKIAREVGYQAWTLPSRDQSYFRNRFGAGPEQVKRIGSFSRYKLPWGKPFGYASGRYFIYGIERHKGSQLHTWLGRMLLVVARLRILGGSP